MNRNTGQVTGRVFHIIKGSFVDGYGIRSTVFLKGCPLKCLWCCNPEGQKTCVEVRLEAAKCSLCGNCVQVCSKNAVSFTGEEERPVTINRRICDGCGECFDVCYTGAIESWSRDRTVDEVFRILAADKEFYDRSGGGVSIGGGEPTLQPVFTLALIRKLHEAGIHVNLDTCGYVNSPMGIRCMEEADMLLFDIKGIDEEEHIRNTGVSNRLILENFRKMADQGKPMIVRLPLIPGQNDSRENICAIAELLAGAPSVERVDIMAYHQFGITKYRQLEWEYPLKCGSLTEEFIQETENMLRAKRLNVQRGG